MDYFQVLFGAPTFIKRNISKKVSIISDYNLQTQLSHEIFFSLEAPFAPWGCGGVNWSWAKLGTQAHLIRRYCITFPDNVLLCLPIIEPWNKPGTVVIVVENSSGSIAFTRKERRRKKASKRSSSWVVDITIAVLSSHTIFEIVK